MSDSNILNEENFPDADWFYLKNGNIAAVIRDPKAESIREQEFSRRYDLFAAVYDNSDESAEQKILDFENAYNPRAGKAMYAYVSDGHDFWLAAVGEDLEKKLGRNRQEAEKYLKKVLAIWKGEKITSCYSVVLCDGQSGKELDHAEGIQSDRNAADSILRSSGLLRKYATDIETELYSGFREITGVLHSVESYQQQKSDSAAQLLHDGGDYYIIVKGDQKRMVCFRASDGKTHCIPVYIGKQVADHAAESRGTDYGTQKISFDKLVDLLRKPSFSEVRIYTADKSDVIRAQMILDQTAAE
ncbi:MAG: hypothetical protein LIV24_10095 [Eubacterium sp.]|nr:hypothetical protein [Eubacterium sp.]